MKKDIDFSANGKLLLTGEYLVLKGAEALAFPVRFGQSLSAESDGQPFIRWVSKENGITWFSCDLDPESLNIISTSDHQVANRLIDILLTARKINLEFLNERQGLNLSVEANYPLKWGLGSSSTLIALIAKWAGVDPFLLFRSVSGGSGYDIACALRKEMFFYQVKNQQPIIRPACPGKALNEYTCFAYLGKKQETAKEVSAFLATKNDISSDIDKISELTNQICQADDPLILCSLVDEHEEILSRILKKERVAKRFSGFPGTVKSLGAWGGDFAMFVCKRGNEFIKTWLKHNGFNDVFTFDELKPIT